MPSSKSISATAPNLTVCLHNISQMLSCTWRRKVMLTARLILLANSSKPTSSARSTCWKLRVPIGNGCRLKNEKLSVSTIFPQMKSMAICTVRTICLPKPRHTRRPAPIPLPRRPATILCVHGCALTVCRPS